MSNKEKLRNVLFILLGVAGLLLKQHYNEPYSGLGKSYLGNISVSFAIYFLVSVYAVRWKKEKFFSAAVTLIIVDLYTNAGDHEIEFNAGNLPSGVYFYKMKCDDFSKTRQLLLLK